MRRGALFNFTCFETVSSPQYFSFHYSVYSIVFIYFLCTFPKLSARIPRKMLRKINFFSTFCLLFLLSHHPLLAVSATDFLTLIDNQKQLFFAQPCFLFVCFVFPTLVCQRNFAETPNWTPCIIERERFEFSTWLFFALLTSYLSKINIRFFANSLANLHTMCGLVVQKQPLIRECPITQKRSSNFVAVLNN